MSSFELYRVQSAVVSVYIYWNRIRMKVVNIPGSKIKEILSRTCLWQNITLSIIFSTLVSVVWNPDKSESCFFPSLMIRCSIIDALRTNPRRFSLIFVHEQRAALSISCTPLSQGEALVSSSSPAQWSLYEPGWVTDCLQGALNTLL